MDPFQSLFGTVTIRTQRIVNFETFLLSHVPYGQVDPAKNIQKGLVQYDGPRANGLGLLKPLLQWHFGGVPYPITKAMRVDYSYAMWDGSATTVNASILIGFQRGFTQAHVKRAPRAVPPPPAVGVAVPALAAPVDLQQLAAQVGDVFRQALAAQPTSIVTGSANAFKDFDTFIEGEWNPKPANWGNRKQQPFAMEFDGPAQNYDSHNPFAYTRATLFNDSEKYKQLLWWYFGGTAHTVTKAIRIPIDAPADAQNVESLFIGFTGPGSCPNC